MTTRRAVAGAIAVLMALGAVSAAVAWNGGAGAGGASPPPTTTSTTSTTTGKVEATAAGDPVVLKQYGDCRTVLDEARKQALTQVTAYGINYAGNEMQYAKNRDMVAASTTAMAADASRSSADGGASSAGSTAAPSASEPAFSGTNLQEAGVDEPDIVKND